MSAVVIDGGLIHMVPAMPVRRQGAIFLTKISFCGKFILMTI